MEIHGCIIRLVCPVSEDYSCFLHKFSLLMRQNSVSYDEEHNLKYGEFQPEIIKINTLKTND